MKKMLFMSVLTILALSVTTESKAQKKVRTFTISRIIDAPAADIWKIVGEDYGAIAKSHPEILRSEYLNGSLVGAKGAERICYFTEDGSRFVKEKITEFDPDNMRLVNIIYQAGRFPVDPDYTKAVYQVVDLGNGRSKISFDMQFRTKPAMMAVMMQGKFKKLIKNYLISVEHHVKTQEVVNKENFKTIKKLYHDSE